MSKFWSFFPLIITLFLAGLLFIYKLDSVPSGFYVDEALPGYSAYSLLQTGKDEWGKSFPIAFRFFGFYSPPLFTYLLVPIIGIFGPTVFAIRLLSALTGLLGILLIYLLAKELFKSSIKYIAPIVFATSPWVVLYSRIG